MRTVIIQPADVDRAAGHKTLLFEMFKLRAKVFKEILGWDVHVDSMGLEHDFFDTSPTNNPVYVLVIDEKDVIGSLRLLPTTGPTMLSEVFRDTLPGKPVCDPRIWECSRVCWRPSTKLRQLQVSLKLIEGIREVAARHAIQELVGNFDDKMAMLYSRAGFAFELLGKTRMFGPEVHLGRFSISADVLAKVEATLNRYIEQLQSYQGAA